MTVLVLTAHADPEDGPVRYENCDAMVEQGTLHIVRRSEEPSQYHENTTYSKITDVAYYAPGAWLVCSFENEEAK